MVNGFDLVFMLIYFVYLVSRTYGFHYRDDDAMALGADWLAIGEQISSCRVNDPADTRYRGCPHLPPTGFRHFGQ